VDQIVDIEQLLFGTVRYEGPNGVTVERTLSGQLDVLMFSPPDGAVVIDWKSTFALPAQNMSPDGGEEDGAHVSYEGYFQQRFYGWLVMMSYPAIQWVTLREFYPRRGKAREATLHRADLEHVERELALLAEAWDQAVAAGDSHAGTLDERDAWRPSPGKHCGFCPKPGLCPIEAEARGEGAAVTGEVARRYAGEFEVASRRWFRTREALKVYTAANGPLPLKDSKGRRMIGYSVRRERHRMPNGEIAIRTKTVFGSFTPEESDRGAEPADLSLTEVMRESVEQIEGSAG
jgi:hypothetical protein